MPAIQEGEDHEIVEETVAGQKYVYVLELLLPLQCLLKFGSKQTPLC